MKCLTTLLLLYVTSVYARGLIEEYTWSRISYAIPSGRRVARYTGTPHTNTHHVTHGNSQFMFPGDNSQFGQTGNQFGQSGGQFGQSGGQFGQSGNQFGQSGNQFGQSGGQFGQNGGQFGQGSNQFGQGGGQFGQSGGQFGQSGGQFGQSGGQFGQSGSQFGQGGQFGQSGGQFGQGGGQFGQSGSQAGQSGTQFGQGGSRPIQNAQQDVSLNTGNYIYQNNIPMGANRWRNKMFITVPRRRNGVPSTLNFIWTNSSQRHNVPLIPYPNYEINQLPIRPNSTDVNDVHLVSVYRTAVDVCNRLWLTDSGLIEIPGNATQVQQPSLVIIDLITNRVIHKYNFQPSDLRPNTNLASLVIDVTSSNCNDAYAYMPDLGGYGLVVYSLREDTSWRVTHNYFYLEPLAGEFHVGGVNFQWNDGVFSVALSDFGIDGFRTLYFHSMAGSHIYSVSTRILRNQQLATRSYHENDFRVEIDRDLNSQTASSDLHIPTGVLFLALVNQNAIGCWNTRNGARLENFDVVHRDDQRMIYPCDLKIVENDVIVLSNTMPVFLYSALNYDEVNFRIWIANVNDAIQGTACAGNARPSTPNRRH